MDVDVFDGILKVVATSESKSREARRDCSEIMAIVKPLGANVGKYKETESKQMKLLTGRLS